MQERYRFSRTWASPVHASMMKKRHKFGIDGRILLVPIIFPCIIAIPFGHDFMHQMAFAAIGAVLWLGAKILWEVNPYFIDDFMAETRMPRVLTDQKHTYAATRRARGRL